MSEYIEAKAFSDLISGEYTDSMKSLSAMTATERTEWAQTRTQFFSSGVNKDSLEVMESAIFHVSKIILLIIHLYVTSSKIL